jgi:hypothetical protein
MVINPESMLSNKLSIQLILVDTLNVKFICVDMPTVAYQEQLMMNVFAKPANAIITILV